MASDSRSHDIYSAYISRLIDAGYNLDRARKALAATGYQGFDAAHQWLKSHTEDQNELDYREYILYICPTGELLNQISSFYEASKRECGWNGAHNYLPHISLTSFFQVSDSDVANVIRSFKELNSKKNSFLQLLDKIPVELYVSQNYMGLYITKSSVPGIQNFVKEFVADLKIKGAKFKDKNGEKKLHLPLAYHFSADKYRELSSLLYSSIKPDSRCNWELKMFSRDPQFAGSEFYRVLHGQAVSTRNLPLKIGDIVCFSEESRKREGAEWVEGTSWNTGVTGLINTRFIERIAASDTWISYTCPDRNICFTKALPTLSLEKPLPNEKDVKNIYIMRHGERVDFTFGNWIPLSFDQKGNYMRKDINMPKMIPKRIGGPQAYAKDCPLTTMGELQALITGEAMRDCGIKIDYAFVSPSYRCIQTAHNVLLGLGLKDSIPLCIEPGLFEWTAWYADHFPSWSTPKELSDNGFFINTNYSPVIKYEHLSEKSESLEQYYNRSFEVITSIIHMTGGLNFIIIAHAASLDTCSRQLTGKPPKNFTADLNKILPYITYCSIVHLQNNGADWRIVEPPFPPLTHSNNQRFDYRILEN